MPARLSSPSALRLHGRLSRTHPSQRQGPRDATDWDGRWGGREGAAGALHSTFASDWRCPLPFRNLTVGKARNKQSSKVAPSGFSLLCTTVRHCLPVPPGLPVTRLCFHVAQISSRAPCTVTLTGVGAPLSASGRGLNFRGPRRLGSRGSCGPGSWPSPRSRLGSPTRGNFDVSGGAVGASRSGSASGRPRARHCGPILPGGSFCR